MVNHAPHSDRRLPASHVGRTAYLNLVGPEDAFGVILSEDCEGGIVLRELLSVNNLIHMTDGHPSWAYIAPSEIRRVIYLD